LVRDDILSRVTELENANQWAEAESLLREALSSSPTDADLAAALGHILCLTSREDEAAGLARLAAETPEGHSLVRILAHHYHLKKLAAKRIRRPDPHAESRLEELKRVARHRGIELSPFPGIRLSACLIVRDEERHLPECLQSLKGVCDEVVVVDTGSTDATVAIAESYGCKVGHTEWTNDFSAARNVALDLATGDWALWIDADERLDGNSYSTILSGLVRPQFGGFTIPIINYLNDDESQDLVQHRPCRLFRLLPEIRFEGKIHEQITPSIHELGLPIAHLDGALIHHYGYRASEMDAKNKGDRNISLILSELERNPEDGFHWFNLGNSYFNENEWEKCAEACKKAAGFLEPGIYHGQFCYQLWAFSLHFLGRFEEAIDVCDQADSAGFGGQLIEYARAFCYHSLGKYEDALRAIRAAKSQTLEYWQTGDLSIGAYKADFLEAQILVAMGQNDEALPILNSIVERQPTFKAARLFLALELKRRDDNFGALDLAMECIEAGENGRIAADLAVSCASELGLTDKVLMAREAAWRVDPTNLSLWNAWVLAAELAESWEIAVQAYCEHAQNFDPDPKVLINAGRALERVGAFQLALQCYEDAILLDPQDSNAYFNAGDLLYRSEKFSDAVLFYRKGVELAPGNDQGWFVFGNALYQSGSPAAAIIAYETSLAINPSHVSVKANLELARKDVA
jgi:tetratricopeptide (TPR) repeat protein